MVVHFSIFFQGIINIAGISNAARPLVTQFLVQNKNVFVLSNFLYEINKTDVKPAKDLYVSKIWVKSVFY